jgi:hypothetical protein
MSRPRTPQDRLGRYLRGGVASSRAFTRFASSRSAAEGSSFGSDDTTAWHTDLYEHRGGRWQATWPQATQIGGDR